MLPDVIAAEGSGEQSSHSLAQSLARSAPILAQVLSGTSLGSALSAQPAAPPRLRAASHDLVYNALRGYGRLEELAARLLHKPPKSRELYALVIASLGELEANAIAAHTVVDQAVEAAFARGEAAEHVVMVHHGFAVGADLQIDLDAVAGRDRRTHGAGRIFDHPMRGIMQATVRDRSRDEPI